MSHYAHNPVRLWTVRPLGVRPQEFFFLTTGEPRWTQIFRGVANGTRPGVVNAIWPGISLVAPKVVLSVLICVHLWFKAFPIAPPENPAISRVKICENPSKNPHRQPSSTPKNFQSPHHLPGPPDAILNPQSSILSFWPRLPAKFLCPEPVSGYLFCP
jgi:hypothetical protein